MTKEVAHSLRISESTALRLMRSGEIRSFQLTGARGGWRTTREELEKYIARRMAQPTEAQVKRIRVIVPE